MSEVKELKGIKRIKPAPLTPGEVVALGYEKQDMKFPSGSFRKYAAVYKRSLGRLDTGLEFLVKNPNFDKTKEENDLTNPKQIPYARIMEKKLGKKPMELAPDSEFWNDFSARLECKTNLFDLSIPEQELQFYVLKANTDAIAESLLKLDSNSSKPLFYIEDPEADAEKLEKAQESLQEATMLFMEMSPEQKRNVSWILGLPMENKKEVVVNTNLFTLLQKNPEKFLIVAKKNKDLVELEALVLRAIDKGVLRNTNGKIYKVLPDGNLGAILGNDVQTTVSFLKYSKKLRDNRKYR